MMQIRLRRSHRMPELAGMGEDGRAIALDMLVSRMPAVVSTLAWPCGPQGGKAG
jgi:hypothetical protein